VQQQHLQVGVGADCLVQTLNSPLGVLTGIIRDPPESTSRGSQPEVPK
jgi:hypothetical protein